MLEPPVTKSYDLDRALAEIKRWEHQHIADREAYERLFKFCRDHELTISQLKADKHALQLRVSSLEQGEAWWKSRAKILKKKLRFENYYYPIKESEAATKPKHHAVLQACNCGRSDCGRD